MRTQICNPISRVQGSKPGSPRRVPDAKNDFLGVPVSEVSFHRLEYFPVDVQTPYFILFGLLWGLLGPQKTWIPYSKSVTNQVFKVSVSKTPLGSVFIAFWGSWRRLRSFFRLPLGALLSMLMGGRSQKMRICLVRFACIGSSPAKATCSTVSGGSPFRTFTSVLTSPCATVARMIL